MEEKNNEIKLECDIDGDCLSIVRDDFINLAESESVFIELTKEQIKEINTLKEGKNKIGDKYKQLLKKEFTVDVKLLVWDIADYLSRNKNIDLKTFNEFAIKNGITPKEKNNE